MKSMVSFGRRYEQQHFKEIFINMFIIITEIESIKRYLLQLHKYLAMTFINSIIYEYDHENSLFFTQ